MANAQLSSHTADLNSSEWPDVAAAAVAWWDAEPRPVRKARVKSVRRSDSALDSQWPGVAAAAGAWWDEVPFARQERKARNVVGAPANDPQWPEIAAAAGAWWAEPLASGPFATGTFGHVRQASVA
jgi:hypothetical protein